jgi:hypothetical protein
MPERKTAPQPASGENGKDIILLPPAEVVMICPPQTIDVVAHRSDGHPSTFTVSAADRATLAVVFALCRYLRENRLKGYMKLPAIQDAFANGTAPNPVRVRAALQALQARRLMDSFSNQGYIPHVTLTDLERIATSPEEKIELMRLSDDGFLAALRGLRESGSQDIRHQLEVFIISEALPEGESPVEAHMAAAALRETTFRGSSDQVNSQGPQPPKKPAPVTLSNKPGRTPGLSWGGPRSVESNAPNRFTEQFPRFAQMLRLHGSELTGPIDKYIILGLSLDREQMELLKDHGNPERSFRELLVSFDSATDPTRVELRDKLIHELKIFCCLPKSGADCHSIEDILTSFLIYWDELIAPSLE